VSISGPVNCCGFVPSFFLSPIGGVWADRYNRKLLIIMADSLIAVATLVLAVLFFVIVETVVEIHHFIIGHCVATRR
jgi:MFS family permease